jgi:hypothetical protein
MPKVGIQQIGRRTKRIVVDLRLNWPQIRDNSRKARGRMAAGRGGGLSDTIFKEYLGAVIGENNAD